MRFKSFTLNEFLVYASQLNVIKQLVFKILFLHQYFVVTTPTSSLSHLNANRSHFYPYLQYRIILSDLLSHFLPQFTAHHLFSSVYLLHSLYLFQSLCLSISLLTSSSLSLSLLTSFSPYLFISLYFEDTGL